MHHTPLSGTKILLLREILDATYLVLFYYSSWRAKETTKLGLWARGVKSGLQGLLDSTSLLSVFLNFFQKQMEGWRNTVCKIRGPKSGHGEAVRRQS